MKKHLTNSTSFQDKDTYLCMAESLHCSPETYQNIVNWLYPNQFSSVQSLSHVRLFATPWTTTRQASLSITNSRSPPKTHVHWVSDAIQPSHPLSSPPPALNLSQHQGLFQGVSSSHQVAKVLEFQLQHQSFQWTPRTDRLQDGLVGSPCSPRDSQESSQDHSS